MFDKNGQDNGININFDLIELNTICSYVISNNLTLKKSHFINLKKLMDIVNKDLYINDTERYKRYVFIKKGLEARIDKNINNRDLVLNYINGSIIDNEFIDLNNFKELTSTEIMWVNETIAHSIDYSYIYNNVDKMLDICTRFKATDYRSRGSIAEEFENLSSNIQNEFRRIKCNASNDTQFSLCGDNMVDRINEFYESYNSTSNMLYTGMQGLNELLGGGFQNQRFYLFIGNSGGGKSLTLLDLIYQMKKYNLHYETKDKTKIPTIVYITQENSESESVERLLSMALSNGGFKNYESSADIMTRLREEKSLCITDESNINILIKFVPNRSIDTSYLYTLYDDLLDDGLEMICLVQDHIKRIKSVTGEKETRLELGNVVNEMKTFAILKDIPVISISHINRDGVKIIEENKLDSVKALGKSSIGESLLMIDNSDGAFIIGPEYDANMDKYMAFNRIKERYECSGMKYICHPYSKTNNIKLVEDLYSTPVYKETLKEQVQKPMEQRSKLLNNFSDMFPDVENKKNNMTKINKIEEKPTRKSFFDNNDEIVFAGSSYTAQETMYRDVFINRQISNDVLTFKKKEAITFMPTSEKTSQVV